MPKVTPETVAAETEQERRSRCSTILRRLRGEHEAKCALRHETPWQLLVATIMSAQSTDEQVNRLTPALFAKWPDAESTAEVSQEEMEQTIGGVNFFRNKSKAIRGAARMIVEDYDGEVPRTMKSLLRVPGVARKTANVVLGTAYGKAYGVVVDTHVARLSQRMGMTEATQPDKIEKDLMNLWAKPRWIEGAHTMIWHGRRVCKARKPDCASCCVHDLCPKIGVEDGA